MVTVRGLVSTLALTLGMTLGVAAAQLPKPAPPSPIPARPGVPTLIGAAEVVRLAAPTGFIDDVVAADDQRIAYVVADTSSKAELHVYTHATKQEKIVDLAPITLQPVSLTFVGSRVLVVGKTEDGSQIGALVELSPKGGIVYRIGPANHITVIRRDGKQRIAVHKASSTKAGTRHDVEIVAIETGKRIAAARPFELDATDKNAKLDFKVNHWSDGMTRVYGIKAGEWDKKENERAPDVEAAYDLVTGKVFEKAKIVDLFEQRRRFQTLATQATRDFISLSWDNLSVQLWRAGKVRSIELDQPIMNYDSKSMQGVVNTDGTGWVVFKMDPVNAEAVARKKADPEYLDVFRVGADGKAVLKARVLAHGVRHRFGVVGDKFWLIERNSGFERGGRSLTLYSLK